MSRTKKYIVPELGGFDSEQSLLAKLVKLSSNSNGADVIENTTAYTGRWFKVKALADSVITVTCADITLRGSGSFAMNAGTEILGDITGITLASGTVIAYRTDTTATASS